MNNPIVCPHCELNINHDYYLHILVCDSCEQENEFQKDS